MNQYPRFSRLRLLVDRRVWHGRIRSENGPIAPAGAIGVVTCAAGGWYSLESDDWSGFADIEHHDVEPACRLAWDHALAEGWVSEDEWFQRTLALD